MVIVTLFYGGFSELNELGASKHWSSYEVLDTTEYKKNKDERNCRVDSWNLLESAYRNLAPDELVVGNLIDSLFLPFVLNKKKQIQRITVLDDGTPTLGVAAKRKHGGFYSEYHLRSPRLLLKYLFYLRTFPPLFSPPKHLNFFSMFDLPFAGGDRLSINDFQWLQTRKTEQPVIENEVVFIGSNIVDKGLVAEADFLNSLADIRAELNNRGLRLTYCHHRGESDNMRGKVREICDTEDFDAPLELTYLNRPRPGMILGHFSSALFTLSRIYPEVRVCASLFETHQILGSEFEPHDYLLLVQETIRQDDRIELFEPNTRVQP